MFNIEYALPRCSATPRLWGWSVKVPIGLYEILVTNDKGRGLYIQRVTGTSPGSAVKLTQLLAEEEFAIPDNVTEDQSIALLEDALNQLVFHLVTKCTSTCVANAVSSFVK